MKVKVELHVHSRLSACADTDNTVCNIANLSVMTGTQILALSDHNTCLNFPAFEKVCKHIGLVPVPAIEVTTAEDIHVLCLFENFDAAKTLSDKIYDSLPKVEVNRKFYNPQLVLDEDDQAVYEEPYLLNLATQFDVYSLAEEVNSLGGIAIPAHIDRESNGILAVLGAIPDDLNVSCVEVSYECDESVYREYAKKYNVIRSSDAHCLEDLCKNEFYLDVDRMSAKALIERLKKR